MWHFIIWSPPKFCIPWRLSTEQNHTVLNKMSFIWILANVMYNRTIKKRLFNPNSPPPLNVYKTTLPLSIYKSNKASSVTMVTVNPPSWLSLCSDPRSRRRCCSGIERRGSWWSSSSSRRCSGRNPDRGRRSGPSSPGCKRWLVRTLNCSMPTTQLSHIINCLVWIKSSVLYSVVVRVIPTSSG